MSQCRPDHSGRLGTAFNDQRGAAIIVRVQIKILASLDEINDIDLARVVLKKHRIVHGVRLLNADGPTSVAATPEIRTC